MSERRVVVTGLGTINPLGDEVDVFWKNALDGVSGVSTITSFETEGMPTTFAGWLPEFDAEQYMPRKEARRLDRFAQLFVAASGVALKDAGLEYEEGDEAAFRVGVATGSGIGGMLSFQQGVDVIRERGASRLNPMTITQIIPNMAGGVVSIHQNLYGPNICTVTACAASANAVGDAAEIIKRDDADVMVAGGAEAPISMFGLAAFTQPRALSRRSDDPSAASRPFDAERDGFVMAEGAAILILEEREHALARGATIYSEVLGYGMSADGYHVTLPRPGGMGAALAMKRALASAALDPSDIDYINAHGTSTQANDATETAAIKVAFGDHAAKVAISSTKSMTGHLLGGAGAAESLICTLAIRDGWVPPTINYEYPDPECDLDYVPNHARQMPVRYAMTNSFGFGGHNVSLIFGEHR